MATAKKLTLTQRVRAAMRRAIKLGTNWRKVGRAAQYRVVGDRTVDGVLGVCPVGMLAGAGANKTATTAKRIPYKITNRIWEAADDYHDARHGAGTRQQQADRAYLLKIAGLA